MSPILVGEYINMTRPKLYDREKVLERATELFWERGFEATSMKHLAKKMKINVNTIYNEFDNKDNLFALCIRNFIENFCQVEEILTNKPLGLKNIERFFEYKISVYHSEGAKGCLVFNALMEEESISKEANKAVNAFMKGMRNLYNKIFIAAKRNKEIRSTADINMLTDFMCQYTYGFVNLGMKSMSKKDLLKSIAATMKFLRS